MIPGLAQEQGDAVWGALFQTYPDAVLLAAHDGQIVRANDAASALLGYRVEELQSLKIEALVPDAVRARHASLRAAYQRAPTRRPMGLQMALSARKRDGSEVMVEIALSPLEAAGQSFVLAAIRGVGEYPRVRQALQRTRHAECIAQMGRLAVDSRDGQAVLQEAPRAAAQALDAAAAALFVLDRDGRRVECAGAFGPPLALPDAAELGTRPVPAAARRRGAVRACLSVPVADRGRIVGALEVHAAAGADLGEETQRFVESLASLLATVLQRQAFEDQLRHAQRLEAVGQLTGGIAHDFNNLLTVIQGNLQVLEDLPAIDSDALAQDLVAAATRASRRGAELTAKLLAFSRRQMLSPRAIDLHAMLPPLAALLQRTLDARIRIEVAIAPDCPPCLADAAQLEAALLNLAINARDAMPEGGTLRFAAARCALPPLPLPVDAQAWRGGGVALALADSGVGMSGAVLARAFEPFFTTKEAGRGTGLGLATVHGFVHQSQGVVTLDSEVGVGTTVTLYLPGASTAPAPPPAHGAAPSVPHGLAVLLVEDEPEVLRVVQTFLEQWGCRVVACSHAAAALEVAAGTARFDLLLSDVALGPGLRGDQLAERLRAQQPALPVLLMSGYAQDAPGARWPLLRKPFTREQLAEALLLATAAAQ
jgi:PAS domain S-box-containing protein